MRFQTTPSFEADWARLTPDERRLLSDAIRAFSDACDRFVEDRSARWPADLRIKKIRNAKGVFELTWSFAGPDGRASWEWVTIEIPSTGPDGERLVERVPAIRWRRIGNHRIFSAP